MSPWLTTAEASEYLRCPTRDACRKWLDRHHVATVKRGRIVLVHRGDLERVLGIARQSRTKRPVPVVHSLHSEAPHAATVCAADGDRATR